MGEKGILHLSLRCYVENKGNSISSASCYKIKYLMTILLRHFNKVKSILFPEHIKLHKQPNY